MSTAKGKNTTEELVSLLNEFYITPHIEDDELLRHVSLLYQDLTPRQKDLCGNCMPADPSFLASAPGRIRSGSCVKRLIPKIFYRIFRPST